MPLTIIYFQLALFALAVAQTLMLTLKELFLRQLNHLSHRIPRRMYECRFFILYRTGLYFAVDYVQLLQFTLLAVFFATLSLRIAGNKKWRPLRFCCVQISVGMQSRNFFLFFFVLLRRLVMFGLACIALYATGVFIFAEVHWLQKGIVACGGFIALCFFLSLSPRTHAFVFCCLFLRFCLALEFIELLDNYSHLFGDSRVHHHVCPSSLSHSLSFSLLLYLICTDMLCDSKLSSQKGSSDQSSRRAKSRQIIILIV